MRKHFLLLFLMAILPLAGWAIEDPIPYKFTLSQDIIQSTSTTNVANAPTVTSIIKKEGATELAISSQGAVYDLNKKIVGSFETSGYYYRMVYFKDGDAKKAAYVPFYVIAQAAPFKARVNNETSFNGSLNTVGAAYWYYYGQAGYGWCDVWYQYGENEEDGVLLYPGDQPLNVEPWKNTTEEFDGMADQEHAANWYATLKENDSPTEPRYIHSWYATQTSNPDNWAFSFHNAGNETWRIAVKYDGVDEAWYPWEDDGIQYFGAGEGKKHWGLISAPNDIKKHFTKNDVPVAVADYDEAKVSFSLIPSNPADTLVADAGVIDETTIVEYTEKYYYQEGVEQKPQFTAGAADADAWVYLASGSKDNALVEGVDYQVIFSDANYINPGTKNFKVQAIGIYGYSDNDGKASTDLVKTYRIIGDKVVINPAYTYKTYGQADPEHPNYEFEGELVGTDNLADAITPYLTLVRKEGQTGEAVGEYEYSIGFTDNYYTDCKYEITILQAYSLLKIQKANVQVNVKNYWKEYNTSDPTTFEFTVAQGSELQNNETPATSGIKITRTAYKANETAEAISEQVNATATLDGDGKVVAATKNVENPTYAFKAESNNYNVTFGNEFLIVPTTATDGVQVAFTEQEHVYNGLYQTPEFTVTDNNGAATLVKDKDFVIDSWEKNKNVGTAKVKISLIGNYVANTAASKKEGTFTITKAPLTITPNSVTAEQTPYACEVDGFVNGETVESEFGKNTNDTTFFNKATKATITAKKGASVEQNVYELVVDPQDVEAWNYEIKYAKGLLALNGTQIIIAWPEPKEQVYGDAAKELTAGAKFATSTTEGYVSDDAALAALKISGKPVYTLTREDKDNKNVGKYDINITGPTLLQGYTVNYVTERGTDAYEITYRPLTLTANDKVKAYREAVPTLDATVGKMAYNEKPEDIGLVHGGNGGYNVTLLSSQGWRYQNNAWINVNGEHAGTYTIRAAFRNNHSDIYGNYRVTLVNGTLTVNPLAVTVTAKDDTKQFGTDDPESFAYTVKDSEGKEVSAEMADELHDFISVTRPDAGTEDGEKVGKHTIVAAAPVNAQQQPITPTDYTITQFNNGTLTITPAQMYIVANDQWINYYGNINPYDVTITIPAVTEAIYKWQKKGAQGLTPEQEKINEFIQSILKGLTVKDDKQAIGANAEAYEYELNEGINYELAENGFTNGYLTVYPLDVIPLGKEALAEVTNAPLKQVLNDHKGLKVNVVLPNRSMVADEWYTWVLPFKVKPSQLFRDAIWGYGALETLDVNKSHDESIVFGLNIAKEVPANTPFIVKVENAIDADDMDDIVFENVEIANDVDYVNDDIIGSKSNDGKVKFIGLYDEKTGFDATEMYNGADPNDDMHRKFFTGGEKSKLVKVKRTNAYLKLASNSAHATVFIEEPDGTLTAISNVNTDEQNANAEGIYNLNGVKLNAAPTQKGVYIQNGKKVVIK